MISKFGGLTKVLRQARDLCVSLGIAMTIKDSWAVDSHLRGPSPIWPFSTPPEFLCTATDFNSYVSVGTSEVAPQRRKCRIAACTVPPAWAPPSAGRHLASQCLQSTPDVNLKFRQTLASCTRLPNHLGSRESSPDRKIFANACSRLGSPISFDHATHVTKDVGEYLQMVTLFAAIVPCVIYSGYSTRQRLNSDVFGRSRPTTARNMRIGHCASGGSLNLLQSPLLIVPRSTPPA